MNGNLRKQFAYFLAHQDEIVHAHNGKVVVIADEKVDGVYPDELAAMKEASKSHEPGDFLIQRVAPGEEAVSQTFHSRVAFR